MTNYTNNRQVKDGDIFVAQTQDGKEVLGTVGKDGAVFYWPVQRETAQAPLKNASHIEDLP